MSNTEVDGIEPSPVAKWAGFRNLFTTIAPTSKNIKFKTAKTELGIASWPTTRKGIEPSRVFKPNKSR